MLRPGVHHFLDPEVGTPSLVGAELLEPLLAFQELLAETLVSRIVRQQLFDGVEELLVVGKN
ncbi:MAG: hypothetical protein KF718_02435 [Polyangiaceae bacterium]|nr:hypothetical protein [Polyangiaceae bacterium]